MKRSEAASTAPAVIVPFEMVQVMLSVSWPSSRPPPRRVSFFPPRSTVVAVAWPLMAKVQMEVSAFSTVVPAKVKRMLSSAPGLLVSVPPA